jgi:Zn-dependent alcohol dehydrogenase
MTDNGELHVVFGTGAVGMSVIDELVQRGRQARVVNLQG